MRRLFKIACIPGAGFLLLLLVWSATSYAQSTLPTTKSLYLNHIILNGNDICKRSVILRELNIAEGERHAADSVEDLLRLNKLRLENLAMFNEVLIVPIFTSNDSFDVFIHLKERWFIIPEASFQLADRNFNQWWVEQHHDLNRINLVLGVVDKNFRGNLENLVLYAQLGYTQKFAISYNRPYINAAQTLGWGTYISYATNRQIYYSADSNKQEFTGTYTGPILNHIFEATFSLNYRPAFAVKHLFSVSYKFQDAADTILNLNPQYFGNSLTQLKYFEMAYRMEVNHVDNWSYPTKGQKLVINDIARIGINGMGAQNYINLEAGVYTKISPKFLFSTIARGRITFANQQPFVLTEGLGFMANYVRGYEYYIITGTQYGLLRFDLKYELLNFTLSNIPIKYFTTFPLKIYPKIYFDAGYCYANNDKQYKSFLGNTLLSAAGIGVDIVSAYDFKIRLEYTLNALLQKGLYLHTTSE
jgi:outer membrane protein assembly factor BamA